MTTLELLNLQPMVMNSGATSSPESESLRAAPVCKMRLSKGIEDWRLELQPACLNHRYQTVTT